MSDTLNHAIHQKFIEVLHLAKELEHRPRNWGTDEQLTSAEITFIGAVGDHNEQLSVTDLARALLVTKGAVSQTLKKLEVKGITSKQEDPANNSRSIVLLTTKGKTAYYAHKHWHETMDGGWREYSQGLEMEKKEFLLEFLERTADFYKRAMT